ncbi:hypothetical protein BOTBODRAFT_242147 [Botryobasidium botryosum FD-172 SS1]|uniref:Uncharacterized protein n=1 Tax=Botryobasidium botryosum (strain FD-172 SS1) TaxID=930990 RepID=A0A067MQ93_BOTB1|nr:hypothetical protein BOTBODRAFT_242147 [Botryobasidium botryosum FD-172 SS1]
MRRLLALSLSSSFRLTTMKIIKMYIRLDSRSGESAEAAALLDRFRVRTPPKQLEMSTAPEQVGRSCTPSHPPRVLTDIPFMRESVPPALKKRKTPLPTDAPSPIPSRTTVSSPPRAWTRKRRLPVVGPSAVLLPSTPGTPSSASPRASSQRCPPPPSSPTTPREQSRS